MLWYISGWGLMARLLKYLISNQPAYDAQVFMYDHKTTILFYVIVEKEDLDIFIPSNRLFSSSESSCASRQQYAQGTRG
jgi:hypothetical protein